MHTPLPNVLDVKTALDAFHFLCLVEGKLMSIRACQRLGLGLEREDPTELNDVENAVINAGEAFGGFLLVMQYGYISTLSANGQALMGSSGYTEQRYSRVLLGAGRGARQARCRSRHCDWRVRGLVIGTAA
ncbi:TPA: hypothetical protein ACKP7D_003482 [Serratia marcescens]